MSKQVFTVLIIGIAVLIGFGAGCGSQEPTALEETPAIEQTSVAGRLQTISSDTKESEIKSPGSVVSSTRVREDERGALGWLAEDAGGGARDFFTAAEQRAIRDLAIVLAPFEHAGRALEAASAVLGDVLPAMERLRRDLEALKEGSNIKSQWVKGALRMFLQRHYDARVKLLITPHHKLATALNPTLPPAQRKLLMTRKAVAVAVDVLRMLQTAAPAATSYSAFARAINPRDPVSDLRQQLGMYVNAAAEAAPEGVVKFWARVKTEHGGGELASVALAITSVPAGTAALERSFNHLSTLTSHRRRRFTTANLARRVQIRSRVERILQRLLVTPPALSAAPARRGEEVEEEPASSDEEAERTTAVAGGDEVAHDREADEPASEAGAEEEEEEESAAEPDDDAPYDFAADAAASSAPAARAATQPAATTRGGLIDGPTTRKSADRKSVV